MGSKLLLLEYFYHTAENKLREGLIEAGGVVRSGRSGDSGFVKCSIYTIYLYEHALVLNSSMYNEYMQ